MAVLVVDLLEIIQVQHDQGAAAAVPASIGKLAVDVNAKPTLIQQGRERIMIGEILQLTDKVLAFGDVLKLHDQAAFPLANFGPGWGHGQQAPDQVAIGMFEPLLKAAALNLTADQPVHQVFADCHVFAMHQRREGHTQQLLERIAGELGHRRIGTENGPEAPRACAWRHKGHGDTGIFERPANGRNSRAACRSIPSNPLLSLGWPGGGCRGPVLFLGHGFC